MSQPQSLSNHTRRDPIFHFILQPILLANLILAIIWLFQHPDFTHVWILVLSLAAILLLLLVRMYSMKVQDRVIRLEERLRLQSLAPQEWHAQISRLTEEQLIGLRFAGDGEVVELAKQALTHNWNRKQIKERVQNWRPDDWRV